MGKQVVPLRESQIDEAAGDLAKAMQSQGYGRKLLAPRLDQADNANMPRYLDTSNPKNIPFYQSLGFQTYKTTTDPVSNLQMWTLHRPPNSQT